MSKIKNYIKQKASPYPNTYNFLIKISSLYEEIIFLFHAVYTGKFLLKYNRNIFSKFISKQVILTYPFSESNIKNADDFRKWLKSKTLTYIEGRWTFYIPPQETLKNNLDFLPLYYPHDAGLKILKDFQTPDRAKYTDNRKNPYSRSALTRLLTPTPIFLVQVANYLYSHALGMRVYDLIALQGVQQTFTCYIVQHVDGIDPDMEEYELFMNRFRSILNLREITTIHKRIEKMKDFDPPSCNKNLIVRKEDKNALYVDFQGFLLDDEKWLNRIIDEIKDIVHFGGVRFFRGGKRYLYQSIPGVGVRKRDNNVRWKHFIEMLQESGDSFSGKVVYDVGCNMGLMIYNALSEGAQWGIGWDLPAVVECAEKVLLALGATRFDLVDEEISMTTDFLSRVPIRYRTQKNSILFFLAMTKHVGFVRGIKDLPWEYMFYEGHSNQGLETLMESLRNVSWLKNSQVVSNRCFADGDSPERTVLLLKRET